MNTEKLNDVLVLFYNDRAWLRGEHYCFDIRHGCSALPGGSVVCGVITENKIVLFNTPHMNAGQRAVYNDILRTAPQTIHRYD